MHQTIHAEFQSGSYLFLAIPFAVLVWCRFYNPLSPPVFRIPFVYWYQMLLTVLGAFLHCSCRSHEERAAAMNANPVSSLTVFFSVSCFASWWRAWVLSRNPAWRKADLHSLHYWAWAAQAFRHLDHPWFRLGGRISKYRLYLQRVPL